MSAFIADGGLFAPLIQDAKAAFELAWALDCAGIVVDIAVSADGEVVVKDSRHAVNGVDMTQSTTTTAGQGRHNDSHASVGSGKDESTLPLVEVLADMPTGKILQIAVSPEAARHAVVVESLQSIRQDIAVYLMSASSNVLFSLQSALNLPTLLLCYVGQGSIKDRLDEAAGSAITGLNVEHNMVIGQDDIAQVHRQGMVLACRAVNSGQRQLVLREMGVDMISGEMMAEGLLYG